MRGGGAAVLLALAACQEQPPSAPVVVTAPAVDAGPAGGFYVLGHGLAAHDAGARERARLAVADPPNLDAGLDFAALFGGERWVVLDRRDLHAVGALDGTVSARPGSSLAGRLLVYRHAKDRTQPGEAMLLRRKARAPAPTGG